MNNLTKFKRCFVNRMSLYRQIIITTHEVNRNKRFFNSYSAKKVSRNGLLLSCGLCCGIVGYNLFKDYFTKSFSSIPTVYASTKISPRQQVIYTTFSCSTFNC